MIRIFKLTDLIPLKVGDVTFWVHPLSQEQRGKLLGFSRLRSGVQTEDVMEIARYTLKNVVKGLDGVTDGQDQPYELSFDDAGLLTDECVSELMQLDACDRLMGAALEWSKAGIKDTRDMREAYEKKVRELHAAKAITDDDLKVALEKYPLEGLEIDFSKVRSVKKKPSEPLAH